LRSRGDLRQNVVVLRNEASAGGLGIRVRDRSGGGLAGKQARAACKCADLLRSVIVVGLNRQVAVGIDSSLQIVRCQCRVQAVEIVNLAGGGAEGDVGRRASADGGDIQRRAARKV